jgi:hypothetical protein
MTTAFQLIRLPFAVIASVALAFVAAWWSIFVSPVLLVLAVASVPVGFVYGAFRNDKEAAQRHFKRLGVRIRSVVALWFWQDAFRGVWRWQAGSN